jgi:hypothetical protein
MPLRNIKDRKCFTLKQNKCAGSVTEQNPFETETKNMHASGCGIDVSVYFAYTCSLCSSSDASMLVVL